jgi:hypothetical protein
MDAHDHSPAQGYRLATAIVPDAARRGDEPAVVSCYHLPDAVRK